ncbi:MAG: TonB family protein [Bacteroidales bacterium]|nr:TonB family protein [Bacteroidales bacterium]
MTAKELIIGHLLPIAVAIMVLWLVYRLLFRNSNRLKFNRFYLLTAMLFSLALPLIGLLMGTELQQMVSMKQNLFGGIMLNEITVTANGTVVLSDAELATATRLHFTLWQILCGIYLIGVGVMTLLFLFKVGKIVALILRSPKEKREGYTAVFTGHDHGSFSFLHFSFFPNENVAPDIVRHELSHIRHNHSVDILFAETMMIMQWFNPFIYLYKKELQSLHEYQADRDVVATGADKKNYMMLILQQCTAVDFSGMSNNFSLILTKKRIKMITRNEKNKRLGWRLLATLPVLAVLLIANTKVSAQEMKSDEGDNTPVTVIRAATDGDITTYDINSTENLHIRISNPNNDSIYQQVDVMPEFPGGEKAMMQFVVDNVTYPQSAKDKNIQGKVYVSFVVEKDGSVDQVKVMRSIGGGCDEEAVRVVKAMPKWVPGKKDGKNVRVNYVLPFVFKLNNEENVNQKDVK